MNRIEDNAEFGMRSAECPEPPSRSECGARSAECPDSVNAELQPYIRGNLIATALGVDKKTVHARAEREQWPMRKHSNRFEYVPSPEVAALLRTPHSALRTDEQPRIKFTDLPPESKGRLTALRRQEAVQLVGRLAAIGRGHARRQAVAVLVTKYTDFAISTRSLERWESDFAAQGIDGLVEQKTGAVGRRGTCVPSMMRNLGKALVIEHGSVARAARELALHPDLPADMREVLHEGHASKSYVNCSIRAAIRPAPLTVALAQGPRAARLSGRFTPGDYADVKAGDVYVSDDMTSNVMCWTEWPNARGWIIGQPQILPVLDVGSLRWLTARVIMRDTGQYNSDDVAGVFGDTFDAYGLPRQGVVLEGGIWQSNRVIGTKAGNIEAFPRGLPTSNTEHRISRTGVSDEERIGGFASLRLKVFRSYDPRSKIIETRFNQFQYGCDAFVGYVGRDQRRDLPEKVKAQLALLRVKNPVHHPREFLPHLKEFSDHVQTTMENDNLERNDGVILRGSCAMEKWLAESADLEAIPDAAKWIYRSAMSVSKVTRNGVRVTQGSGSKLIVHYFDNPELLTPREGMKVVVYWNDRNPDADACIMGSGLGARGGRKFIGMARRVQPVGRFSGTDAQLDAEAGRKRAAMHYSRSELRTMQPDMKRLAAPVHVDEAATRIGAAMAGAADAANEKAAEKEDLNRLEKRIKQRALAEPEGDEEQDESQDRKAPQPMTAAELAEL